MGGEVVVLESIFIKLGRDDDDNNNDANDNGSGKGSSSETEEARGDIERATMTTVTKAMPLAVGRESPVGSLGTAGNVEDVRGSSGGGGGGEVIIAADDDHVAFLRSSSTGGQGEGGGDGGFFPFPIPELISTDAAEPVSSLDAAPVGGADDDVVVVVHRDDKIGATIETTGTPGGRRWRGGGEGLGLGESGDDVRKIDRGRRAIKGYVKDCYDPFTPAGFRRSAVAVRVIVVLCVILLLTTVVLVGGPHRDGGGGGRRLE